jgi:V-type ATPase 116kDa subunit family
MIDIFLAMGNRDKKTAAVCDLDKYEYNEAVSGQQSISMIFLVVAFLCVPVMLMVKPLILKRQLAHHDQPHGEGVRASHEKILYEGSQKLGDERMDQIAEIIKNEGVQEGSHSFGDIMIH